MNRSEIPSDVVPSETHIGDQTSVFKMLSGKDYTALIFFLGGGVSFAKVRKTLCPRKDTDIT